MVKSAYPSCNYQLFTGPGGVSHVFRRVFFSTNTVCTFIYYKGSLSKVECFPHVIAYRNIPIRSSDVNPQRVSKFNAD